MIDWETISDIAAKLPGCVESTSYGTPAFKARKKLVLRVHQTLDVFVLRVASVDGQQSLIRSDPKTFFITDHYEGYPWVLVRPEIEPERFRELFVRAWKLRATPADIAKFESGI